MKPLLALLFFFLMGPLAVQAENEQEGKILDCQGFIGLPQVVNGTGKDLGSNLVDHIYIGPDRESKLRSCLKQVFDRNNAKADSPAKENVRSNVIAIFEYLNGSEAKRKKLGLTGDGPPAGTTIVSPATSK